MDKGNKNQSLIVKIICFLLSFGLWLYISNFQNSVRSYQLKNIPVELVNVDSLASSKLALSSNQNFEVNLTLEGSASDVLKAKKEDFKIVADMSAYALKSGENNVPVQIVSYPENINIKNNGFLGIKVDLEDLVKKDLTVASKVNLDYKQNVYEKNKAITPAKISISGPKSSVDKVNEAVIEGDEKQIDKNIQQSFDIKFLDSSGNEVQGITADNNKAQLNIAVTNGKTVPINIKTSGSVQAGLKYNGIQLNRNNVDIIGDISVLDKVSSLDTQPIDLSKLSEGSQVDVQLNLPTGITIKEGEQDIKATANIIKEEEDVTKNITSNVNYENLNTNLNLQTQTQTVTVTLSGKQSDLDKITSDNIKTTVDLANVTDEGTFTYKPNVVISDGYNATVASVDQVTITVKKKA